MKTLQEAVEAVPELYDALRRRDSLANHVCELLRDGKRWQDRHRAWKACNAEIKGLFARAQEL